MIYPPGAMWVDEYPPNPVYWMHQQAGSGASAPKLDSKVFANEVEKYLQEISE